ncbi:MAG TPA: DUF3857 domain-containing protein, partial [Candidatus Acidoferrales bacterium]|nr:DUF3857 domain-containing protein [Candidatus Acidoferrales bacterium]
MNRKFRSVRLRSARGLKPAVSVWPASALALLCVIVLWLRQTPSAAAADDWLPITPEELSMTSEPKAPGAPAIYLYRQVDRNDQTNFEENYVRIKILTEEGRKQGDVEILYFAHEVGIHNIRARTIHPDGTIINFTGKVYDKTVVKAGNLKYAAKTFTLPDVQVGSIIEYRYTVQEEPFLIFNSHWVLSEDLFTRRAKFSVKLYTLMAARWQGQNLPPGAALPKSAPDRVVKLEVND